MLRRKRKRKRIDLSINNFKRSVIYLDETIAISLAFDGKIYRINQEVDESSIIDSAKKRGILIFDQRIIPLPSLL